MHTILFSSKFCDVRLVTFPNELPLHAYVFYMNSTSKLLPMIDTIIKSDAIVGYVDYLEKKYYSIPFPPSCWSHSVEYQPLPLNKMLDSFELLGVCCIVAVLVLVAELFLGRFRKKYQQGTQRENWIEDVSSVSCKHPGLQISKLARKVKSNSIRNKLKIIGPLRKRKTIVIRLT